MEVLVDNDRIDSAPFNQGNIEEGLHLIQAQLCGPGQLIVGLRCDGHDVPSDSMAEVLRQPISSIERLEVFTNTKAALVEEAMSQAAGALDGTDKECQQAAQALSEGRTAEGIQTLGECLRVWQQVHEAVDKSIRMLGLDIEEATINGESLASVIGKPKELLLQIKEALTVQDYVLLADILQYEVGEVADQWRTIAAWLRQQAQQSPATATP